jgi:23S rRNA pseudouridine1911/1915/1917 synthase
MRILAGPEDYFPLNSCKFEGTWKPEFGEAFDCLTPNFMSSLYLRSWRRGCHRRSIVVDGHRHRATLERCSRQRNEGHLFVGDGRVELDKCCDVFQARPAHKAPGGCNIAAGPIHGMKKRPNSGGRRSGGGGRRAARLSGKLEVLYEDDAVVALDKPAGLAAVPVKDSDAPSAFSMLAAELRKHRQRTFVVHRIDRFTSGVLLFAKTEGDRDALVRQFLAHEPVRQYLAVVRGHLEHDEGTLLHFFRREGMFQQLCSERDREAARAELQFIVERKLRGASLVRVQLETGLQNQIRVQFSAIGHPVIGDRKYHPAEADERRIARVALHASHLGFVHPRTGKNVAVDCDVPSDIRSLVKALTPPARR